MIKNLGISQTLKINEMCKKLKENKYEIFNYGFGQSPFKPPIFFRNEINKNIDKNHYLPVQGLIELRESISKHYKNFHNVSIDKNNIIIGPGSKELLFLLNLCINEVIYIIAPYWVSYVNQLKIFGKENYKIIETDFNQKYKVSTHQIMECLDNSYLLLNSPNNPTGITYSYSELKEIVSVCRSKNITIIADEIYQYLNFENQYTTLLELYPENTIVSNGISKWLHSGGYRLGYMIFPDNYKSLKEKVICCASETFSCVNTPLQYGAISIFENFNDVIDYNWDKIECLKLYSNYFYKEFTKMNIKVHKSDGAFYMYLDFGFYFEKFLLNDIENSNELCIRLLNEIGFALLPGNAFGLNNGYTARFSYTNFSHDSDYTKITNDNIKAMNLLNKWLVNIENCSKKSNL